MREEPGNDATRAAWEGEGANAGAASRDVDLRRHVPCLPALPAGCEPQPAWGFHDRTGRFAYEFNRVYGPPDRSDKRGATCRLVKDLSYWSVTWLTYCGTGEERPAGRWLSYARARKLRGASLTFERFSSLEMRHELADLLHVADLSVGPRLAVTLSSTPEVDRPRNRGADRNNRSLEAQQLGPWQHRVEAKSR